MIDCSWNRLSGMSKQLEVQFWSCSKTITRCTFLASAPYLRSATLVCVSIITNHCHLQSMISNIANSKYTTRLCAEKCREFGVWFAEYHNNIAGLFTHYELEPHWYSTNPPHPPSANIVEYQPSSSRLTFHPMYELPLLRKWYQQCPSPTTEELKKFLIELNMAPVRQERDKVSTCRFFFQISRIAFIKNINSTTTIDDSTHHHSWLYPPLFMTPPTTRCH